MAAANTSCPYCNALVPLTEAAAGDRVACPRCGESFVASRPFEGAAPANSAPGLATSSSEPQEPIATSPSLSNAAVAGIVVGVMVLMFGLGLIFALNTVPERVANHQGITKPENTTVPLFLKLLALAWIVGLLYLLNDIWKRIRSNEQAAWYRGVLMVIAVQAVLAVLLVTLWSRNRGTQARDPLPLDLEEVGRQAFKPVPPAELSGLKYLPANVNVAAGLRVAGLEPGQLEKNLRALWPEGSPLPVDPQQLSTWTGLHWDELDHIVIGARVRDEIPPPFVVVAVTRRPVDTSRVVEGLKAQPVKGSKERYRFKLKKPALDAVLWCLTDRQTFLLALDEKDFAAIPASSAEGKLPASLQTLVGERMGSHTWAWVAACDLAPVAGVDIPLKIDLPVKQVTCAGLWLEPLVEPSLHAAIQCSDQQASETLEKLAKERWPGCKSRRQGDWLLLQVSPPR